jgi:hypothetical protein
VRHLNRLGLSLIGLALAVIAAGALLFSTASASPGNGVLYGTDAGTSGLYSLNTSNGVGTFIGTMGLPDAPALAGDPISGVMYAGTGGTQNDTYTVNVGNAASTFVGNGGLGAGGYTSFDFDNVGVLYASANLGGGAVSGTIAGSGGDHLVIVNKVTGAATVVGSYGTCSGVTIPVPASGGNGSCTIEGIDAIAFDASGQLWGALNPRGDFGTPGLYKINKVTGAATFVAPIDDAAPGLHPSGGVVSLQFACDGTLYAGTARRQAPSTDGGMLGKVNTTTGQFTFISTSPVTTGNPANSLGGLAMLPSTCPTPTPTNSPTPSPTPTPTPSPTPTPTNSATPTPTNSPTPTPHTNTPTATLPASVTPSPTGTGPVGGFVDVVRSEGGSGGTPWVLLLLGGLGGMTLLAGGYVFARKRA